MGTYVIAHDLGTTGNKATLYDRDGALVGASFYAYETDYAQTSWAEQNPEDWWEAVCLSTRRLLSETGVARDDIACITFSGQMMGAAPLDRDGRPMRSAIIWADQRALEQERWIGERLAFEEVYRITGHRLSASYSLAKILWIRDHQPEIYRDAYKFMHAKDCIVARLTGAFVTDPSDASSMNLYDLEAGQWSAVILDAVELPADKLPQIRPSTDVVGEVLSSVADEIGVAAGTPVVLGGGDGACAAAGAGVIAARLGIQLCRLVFLDRAVNARANLRSQLPHLHLRPRHPGYVHAHRHDASGGRVLSVDARPTVAYSRKRRPSAWASAPMNSSTWKSSRWRRALKACSSCLI